MSADRADSDGKPAVHMRGVVRHVTSNGEQRRLLDGLTLSVRRGGMLNIVGPSGSGKTTLLRLINRLDDADEGTVEVLGKAVGDWSVAELRRSVSLVFQEPAMLGLSVAANLRLPYELAGRGEEDGLDDRIGEMLERVQLEASLLERDESELSVGQKQRVMLARALMLEPAVLLLDEPTASLDQRTAARLLEQITKLQEANGLTVIHVTHRLEEAKQMGGQTAVLMDGAIAAEGETAELFRDPPNERVGRFVRGEEDGEGASVSSGDAAAGEGGSGDDG